MYNVNQVSIEWQISYQFPEFYFSLRNPTKPINAIFVLKSSISLQRSVPYIGFQNSYGIMKYIQSCNSLKHTMTISWNSRAWTAKCYTEKIQISNHYKCRFIYWNLKIPGFQKLSSILCIFVCPSRYKLCKIMFIFYCVYIWELNFSWCRIQICSSTEFWHVYVALPVVKTYVRIVTYFPSWIPMH